MKTLPFLQFLATKTRTEDICAASGFDDGQPVHGGFVFDGGCYIEDNSSVDPAFAARGKFYLLIERSDWISDDLDWLAKILWAYHYVFETQDVVTLTGDDIRYFAEGYCAACRYDVEATRDFFVGFESVTPREAANTLDAACAPLKLAVGHPSLEKRQLLVLSTACISKATAEWLDSHDPRTEWPVCGGHYGPYGWTFYCSEDNEGEGDRHIPDDLFAVMQFARAQGCDNLLLDRDASTADALPTWEW